jgi:hypothetical protein
MKKFLKLLAMLSVPTLLLGGSFTLSGCSADALTGAAVLAEGGNNRGTHSGGSTKTGADHNEYSGGNNGMGSTKTGADHNE